MSIVLGLAAGDSPKVSPCTLEVGLNIRSVDVVSEHGTMHRDGPSITEPGDPWTGPEWTTTSVKPFSHDGDNAVLKAEVEVDIRSIAPGSVVRLRGMSTEPGFNMLGELVVPISWTGTDPNGVQKALVTGINPIGSGVRKINNVIDWYAEVREPGVRQPTVEFLGRTSPLTCWVLKGAPRNATEVKAKPTPRRLDYAVNVYSTAEDNMGRKAHPLALAGDVVRMQGKHYLAIRHYEPEDAWRISETWSMRPPGCSCFSIINNSILVLEMVGHPGDFDLAEPAYTQSVLGDTWQVFLFDDRNTRYGFMGGTGGANYYEAVLRYKVGSRTFYMPGGTNRIYENPDDVLRVFRTMAWARWDYRAKEWRVMRVIHTYTGVGRDSPIGIRFARAED
jgi:hypothetical protein